MTSSQSRRDPVATNVGPSVRRPFIPLALVSCLNHLFEFRLYMLRFYENKLQAYYRHLSRVVTVYTISSNVQKLCILPTRYFHVFSISLNKYEIFSLMEITD
jgi:hypothetical protein